MSLVNFRVKVYELQNVSDGSNSNTSLWCESGTGDLSIKYVERLGGPAIQVSDEASVHVLFEARMDPPSCYSQLNDKVINYIVPAGSNSDFEAGKQFAFSFEDDSEAALVFVKLTTTAESLLLPQGDNETDSDENDAEMDIETAVSQVGDITVPPPDGSFHDDESKENMSFASVSSSPSSISSPALASFEYGDAESRGFLEVRRVRERSDSVLSSLVDRLKGQLRELSNDRQEVLKKVLLLCYDCSGDELKHRLEEIVDSITKLFSGRPLMKELGIMVTLLLDPKAKLLVRSELRNENNRRILAATPSMDSTGTTPSNSPRRTRACISSLLALFPELESEKDLFKLGTLCELIKTLIHLSDPKMLEYLIQRDVFKLVCGVFEYDWQFASDVSLPTVQKVNENVPDIPKDDYYERDSDQMIGAKEEHYTEEMMKGRRRRRPRIRVNDPPKFRELFNQTRFKNILNISDDETLKKIHENFRIKFFKDVILNRIHDELPCAILTDLEQLNFAEIISFTVGDADCINSIFSKVRSDNIRESLDALKIVKELFQHVKGLEEVQAVVCYHAFNKASITLDESRSENLFSVLSDVFSRCHSRYPDSFYSPSHLSSDDLEVLYCCGEILQCALEHDPLSLRHFMTEQTKAFRMLARRGLMSPQSARPLFDHIIEIFWQSSGIGLQSLYLELFKLLFDCSSLTRTDVREEFLAMFYENYAQALFKPFALLPGETIQLSREMESSIAANINLLCFMVKNHNFQMKYFMARYFVVSHVLAFLSDQTAPFESHPIELAVIKFVKVLIEGREDDFYSKYMVRNNLWSPFFVFVKKLKEYGNENILLCSSLDVLETILKGNNNASRTVLEHLKLRDDLNEVVFLLDENHLNERYKEELFTSSTPPKSDNRSTNGSGAGRLSGASADEMFADNDKTRALFTDRERSDSQGSRKHGLAASEGKIASPKNKARNSNAILRSSIKPTLTDIKRQRVENDYGYSTEDAVHLEQVTKDEDTGYHTS